MPRAKTPRITAAEKQIRVDKVMELIAKGMTRRRILQYASEKTDWKVEERAIDHYIQAAREQFILRSEIDKKELRGILTDTLFGVIEASLRVQDNQRVISAVGKLMDLHGVAKPQEVDIYDKRQLAQLADVLKAKGRDLNAALAALYQEAAADGNDDILQ